MHGNRKPESRKIVLVRAFFLKKFDSGAMNIQRLEASMTKRTGLSFSGFTRREFLKRTAIGGTGLALGLGTNACVGMVPKDINWSEVPDKEFSLDKFDDWIVAHKLYNGINPNLKKMQLSSNPGCYFKGSLGAQFSGSYATPGIDYQSGVLYASASGEVARIVDLKDVSTRLGGYMVYISHPTAGPNLADWVIITMYAHIYKPNLDVGQKVERGEKIADVMYPNHAKLMLKRWQYFVDPDNYGQNQSYMDYWDGKTGLEIENTRERCLKQEQIYWEIRGKANPKLYAELRNHFPKSHRNDGKHKHLWDFVEMFRYIEELYRIRPHFFPGLEQEEFNKLKNEFYANQPIILTLPLKA
jgi:hypothetical protein